MSIVYKPSIQGLDAVSEVSIATPANGLAISSSQELSLTYTAPTVQKFTSGSGTYTTPAGVLYIRVRMIGGGGGGSGSGTSAGTAAADGTDSTFGNLTAGKGLQGVWNAGGSGGGAVTVGAGFTDIASKAGGGSFGFMQVSTGINLSPGGAGGIGGFGSMSPLNAYNSAGNNANNNSGNGGQGGGGNGASGADAGTGGSSGGYIEAIASPPSATYSYAVGGGGAAGGAGGSGLAGGAGGSGFIIVEEFYQ